MTNKSNNFPPTAAAAINLSFDQIDNNLTQLE
jgi:hypothetical protein